MKQNIHPKYNQQSTVVCNSCKNSFSTGSAKDDISVEICFNCHPFYTGKAKIVDTENLVKKFEERKQHVDQKRIERKKLKKVSRAQKTTEVTPDKQVTLRDMLKNLG